MSKKVVRTTKKEEIAKPLKQPSKALAAVPFAKAKPSKPITKASAVKPPKTKEIQKKIVTEVFSDIVEEEFSYCEQEKRTTPYMSQYEYCALISARIAQLTSRSAEWNVPKIKLETPDDYDPLKIATKEVQACLVSLVIRRRLPDGTTEDWLLKDMIFPRI